MTVCTCQKNVFIVKHVTIGNVECFITKCVTIPDVSMPYYKPNGEYGYIPTKRFANEFDDKFRVITYKTSNKHLNYLFKNNEYWNIWNKPYEAEVLVKYKGVDFYISLGEDEFVIKSEFENIRETLTYDASKKVINNVLDSMVKTINIMTE